MQKKKKLKKKTERKCTKRRNGENKKWNKEKS